MMKSTHILYLAATVLVATPVTAAPLQNHDSIVEAARVHITAEARASHGADHRIEVSVSRPDPRLRLPACEFPLETFMGPGARALGNSTVGVRCNGSTPWSLFVPVNVAVHANIVVLDRPLGRGSMITAGDLRMEERNLATLPMGYVTDPTQIEGTQARRTLGAGTVLTPNAVEAPRLVQRGQRVVLTANAGSIQVRVGGEALADATLGERVRVRNLSSRRVVEGVVVGEALVGIDL
jgi:flagella basal body P-ring formation protein FlgA